MRKAIIIWNYIFIIVHPFPNQMIRSFLTFCLFCFVQLSFTQNSTAQDLLGIPQIRNFNNEDYTGAVQNWDVKQDRNGILYFGNNEGLLSYNGRYWNIYHLPNFTSVRSIGIDKKNRIYVGGQDEFGYFFPNAQGILTYTSLVNLLPEKLRNVADIWDISIVDNEVFFRSQNSILHFKNGVIRHYQPNTTWLFLGETNKKVYAQLRGRGLMVFEHGNWLPASQDSLLKQAAVTSIMPYRNDTLILSTLRRGIFLFAKGSLIPFKTQFDAIFKSDRIFHMTPLDKNRYAIGTTSGGVYIMYGNGAIEQKYNYREGLQNNNIRGIVQDKHKNMWLALDDGIAYVAINSAIKNIFPDRTKQITSYAFRKYNQRIYIGTSNGLYTSSVASDAKDLSYSKSSFSEVSNTKGQVWGLDDYNGKLLMAHEDGVSIITGSSAKSVYSLPGTWMFQSLENVYPVTNIIAGTYTGLQSIKFEGNSLVDLGKVKGINETLRFIVKDNNNANVIWASHPYHGVYKIHLNDNHTAIRSTTLFTDKAGLPSKLYNYVFYIKNHIVIATGKGIYEYDGSKNKFSRFKMLGNTFDNTAIQYLREDQDGNIWFVSDKKVGVIDFSKGDEKKNFKIIYISELDGKTVGGFESIYPLDSKNIFIGANKGAYHINFQDYINRIARPDVILGSIRITGVKDSLVFGGYFVDKENIAERQNIEQVPRYSYSLNSIHFEFSSTMFEHNKNLEFSFQLDGFDDKWSAWNEKSEKDYTNLPAGKYAFRIKSRTAVDQESAIAAYSFEILPAWYNTIWLRTIYFIIIIAFMFLFVKWQQTKYRKKQRRLNYLHQLELDRNEKEIIRLQNEKLEADVHYKNKELSTMTMHLVQRGKVLAKIKDVISSVIKNHDINESSPSFRHLIRLIKDVEKKDQEMDHLGVHFNHVNADFFDKLKSKFPELTQNDLKFCAYLSMNLSSKEMAQLMNVTGKAIEVGRYRLRKKLGITPDINLYDFLASIGRE